MVIELAGRGDPDGQPQHCDVIWQVAAASCRADAEGAGTPLPAEADALGRGDCRPAADSCTRALVSLVFIGVSGSYCLAVSALGADAEARALSLIATAALVVTGDCESTAGYPAAAIALLMACCSRPCGSPGMSDDIRHCGLARREESARGEQRTCTTGECCCELSEFSTDCGTT